MTEKAKKFIFNGSRYYITDQGHVENKKRHRIKPFDNGHGYLCVGLSSNGERKNFYVHRLVAMMFIDNPLNLPEVNHIDGNKKNNSVKNLEWVSKRENIHHAVKCGLVPSGSDSFQANLNSEQVKLVFMAYNAGIPSKLIMNAFNVSRHTVCDIANGSIYKKETSELLKKGVVNE